MELTSITLAFRKNGHISSVVFPSKQALSFLSTPAFIENIDDMMSVLVDDAKNAPFGPIDEGLVLFDLDQKSIYAFQEKIAFDRIVLENGWKDINTKRFESLWKDGRIKSTFFNYKAHPLTQEQTFTLFQEKLEQLFREGNIDTHCALTFGLAPPPGWTWKSFEGGMDEGLNLDSGLMLFKELVRAGFTFGEQDYKTWNDFYSLDSSFFRSVHAQLNREEIESETVNAAPLRNMPRL